MSPERYLTFLVHGEPKVGKSLFASTAPGPILALDFEDGGLRHTPGIHVKWDPEVDDDPPDSEWDVCTVVVKKTRVVDIVKRYIAAGDHPFVSIVVDSITEAQELLYREFGIGDDLEHKHWRAILTWTVDVFTNFRELVQEQDQLEALVVIAGSREAGGKMRPWLMGQSRDKVGYLLDGMGYLFADRDDDGEQALVMQLERDRKVEAGTRLNHVFGTEIWNPDLTDMLAEYVEYQLEGEEE